MLIAQIERMADSLAIALSRRQAEEEVLSTKIKLGAALASIARARCSFQMQQDNSSISMKLLQLLVEDEQVILKWPK